ncbi:MAG TPA: hypothetical protein VEW95_12080 [Candidatus Limnocylindrales bacterium]|nr:hypothetical protein [Candidatus Limnocylindrales bacterium]
MTTVAAILLLAGCGMQDPAPTATVAPRDERAASPALVASGSPGEFGPLHLMSVEDAFPDGAAACENIGQLLASGERSDVGYRLSYPEVWHTNTAAPTIPACTLFDPQPFDPAPPVDVAIRVDMPPGGDISLGMGAGSLEDADASITEHTVDGMPALRVAFNNAPSVLWVVGIGGSLPRTGNDRPYLAISVHSADSDELAAFVDVLDRMVATLEVVDS